MPEFYLDSSESITIAFADLGEFAGGYIEAAFFTETSPAFTKSDIESDPAAWEAALTEGQSDGTLPGDAAFCDLALESLGRIVRDCRVFETLNATLLKQAYSRDYSAKQAGGDYWFTRCGHGVGYWEREALSLQEGETESLGDKLTTAAGRFESESYYDLESGKVYL